MTGIHLNYIPGSYRPHIAAGTTLTSSEQKFTDDAGRWFNENGAYAHLQGTRPQTPAYALNDSRVVWLHGYWKSFGSGLTVAAIFTAALRGMNF
jgi:hypothetical protein